MCSECDPAKNDKAWTPLPGLCKIDNKCYKQGDPNIGGCGVCDPAKPNAWTVTGDACYIEDACQKPGDTDSTGCAECKRARTSTSGRRSPASA